MVCLLRSQTFCYYSSQNYLTHFHLLLYYHSSIFRIAKLCYDDTKKNNLLLLTHHFIRKKINLKLQTFANDKISTSYFFINFRTEILSVNCTFTI